MKLYSSLIDRLKTQHHALENIISTIDSDRLLIRPQPDKWNILDNIAHLTSYQPVFIDRINQILIKEIPSFGRYIADEDPGFENCRSLNIDILIKQLNIDRKNLYDLVITLNDSQLDRIGIHKKFGSLNIIEWTEFFLLHEAHHIFTIFQLAHNTELS
jgi:DinB superfamily